MRIKKIMAAVAAAALSLTVAASIAPTGAQAAASDPAIFLVPHQDDEVLTYGAAIKEHLLAGRDVRVVLLTDGSSSGECTKARSGTYGHPNFNLTDGDSTKYTAVDRAACADFRDAEFRDAADRMRQNTGSGTTAGVGILKDFIRSDRKQDGALTAAYVQSVVEGMLANWPDASIKGMTHHESAHADGHADHDAIGEGIKAASGTTDKRYYVKTSLWDDVTYVNTATVEYPINVVLDAYRSFGQHSVVASFCEQYGLAKSERTSLDNGRPCPSTVQKLGGAHSVVHH